MTEKHLDGITVEVGVIVEARDQREVVVPVEVLLKAQLDTEGRAEVTAEAEVPVPAPESETAEGTGFIGQDQLRAQPGTSGNFKQ